MKSSPRTVMKKAVATICWDKTQQEILQIIKTNSEKKLKIVSFVIKELAATKGMKITTEITGTKDKAVYIYMDNSLIYVVPNQTYATITDFYFEMVLAYGALINNAYEVKKIKKFEEFEYQQTGFMPIIEREGM